MIIGIFFICLFSASAADFSGMSNAFEPVLGETGEPLVYHSLHCRRPISNFLSGQSSAEIAPNAHVPHGYTKDVNCDFGGIIPFKASVEVGTYASGDLAFRVGVDMSVPVPLDVDVSDDNAAATRADLLESLLGGTYDVSFKHVETRSTVSYAGDSHPPSWHRGSRNVKGYDLCCDLLGGACDAPDPTVADGHRILTQCPLDSTGRVISLPASTIANHSLSEVVAEMGLTRSESHTNIEPVVVTGRFMRSLHRHLPGDWQVQLRIYDHWGEAVGAVRLAVEVPLMAIADAKHRSAAKHAKHAKHAHHHDHHDHHEHQHDMPHRQHATDDAAHVVGSDASVGHHHPHHHGHHGHHGDRHHDAGVHANADTDTDTQRREHVHSGGGGHGSRELALHDDHHATNNDEVVVGAGVVVVDEQQVGQTETE